VHRREACRRDSAAVLPGRRPALILGVVLLATFVINLDTTMVNVALPALGRPARPLPPLTTRQVTSTPVPPDRRPACPLRCRNVSCCRTRPPVRACGEMTFSRVGATSLRCAWVRRAGLADEVERDRPQFPRGVGVDSPLPDAVGVVEQVGVVRHGVGLAAVIQVVAARVGEFRGDCRDEGGGGALLGGLVGEDSRCLGFRQVIPAASA